MKKKVFTGFSGGIDSAVSAYLLKKKYNVTAVMFINTTNQECNKISEKDAKTVAEYIGIPFKIINIQKEFKNMVIDPFLKSYKNGKTPNPCVLCNTQFKFGYFADWCFKNGADLIATGHYCKSKDGKLYKGKDRKKDQSYFLNGISEDTLKKTIFPIGHMTKKKVRNIAKKIGLPNSSKRDSQEICFIDTSLNEYLNKNINSEKGDIVDIDTNKIVGQHNGIHSVTLGQRKGVLIGGVDEPYFVAKKEITTNKIFVAKGKYNKHLWKDTFVLEDFNFINKKNIGITKGLTATVRYRAKEIKCRPDWSSNTILLNKKVWTPSIGQSLVLYKKDECIGGGIIKYIRQ